MKTDFLKVHYIEFIKFYPTPKGSVYKNLLKKAKEWQKEEDKIISDALTNSNTNIHYAK